MNRGLGRGSSGLVTQPHTSTWALSWGDVGRATSTSTQAGISTTLTDVTSLTTTFTAGAARLYKIEWMMQVGTIAGAVAAFASLNIDGAQANSAGHRVSGVGSTSTGVYYTTLTAGSHTVKVQASTDAGTMNLAGSATAQHVLIVTDVGPA